MPDLNTLDTLIAIVIVLLVLSLIVQSIQSLLKKLLKLKSRQLEESLVDLFENVLDSKAAADRFRLPTLRLLPFAKHPAQLASPEVKGVFDAVMEQFREIGRVASSGRNMLDSISKEDLLKILGKVAPASLLPALNDGLTEAFTRLQRLEEAFERITEMLSVDENGRPRLSLGGDASAKLAKLRDALTPLFTDAKRVFTNEGLSANLLLADLLNLREGKAQEVFDLLGEVQKAVAEESSREPAGSPRAEALSALATSLGAVATLLGDFRQKFDEVVAPLRLRLKGVENWYDTVMQSFEERYHRGMRTYAFIISLVVAVLMNANVLAMYSDFSASPARRDAIIKLREAANEAYQKQVEAAKAAAAADDRQKVQEIVDAARVDIEEQGEIYGQFGLTPLGTEWELLGRRSGAQLLYHLLYLLIGWLLTAALLSLGAPFWHDTLESLFGVKNLLRKRGDIRNVEKEAGAGQPKP